MRTVIVEATNGPQNWGKFLIGQFTDEWGRNSSVDSRPLLSGRGWGPNHHLVLDLQTGEGAVFAVHGSADAVSDLRKHKIWVCPLFEPFLTWLYRQPDPMSTPALIDLPEAPFALSGYRRPGV